MVDKDAIRSKELEKINESLSALADGELLDSELDQLLQQLNEMGDNDREAALQKWAFFSNGGTGEHYPEIDFSKEIRAALESDEISAESALIDGTNTSSELHLKVVGAGVGDKNRQPLSEDNAIGDIDSKTPPHTRQAANQPIWMQWAVAASVCFSVILGWQLWDSSKSEEPIAIASAFNGEAVEKVNQTPIVAATSSVPSVLSRSAQTVSTSGTPSMTATPDQIPVVDVSQWALQKSKNTLDPSFKEYALRHNGNALVGHTVNGSLPLVKIVNFSNSDALGGQLKTYHQPVQK